MKSIPSADQASGRSDRSLGCAGSASCSRSAARRSMRRRSCWRWSCHRMPDLSWWDCPIVASALQAGCRYLLSEDMQHRRSDPVRPGHQPVPGRSCRHPRSKLKEHHGLQMRHRRPAECRQVDALQRADPDGGGAGGELSVLHHRAEHRRRRRCPTRASTISPASRKSAADRPDAADLRRHRRPRARRRRRAKASATSSSPISARSTPSPMCCAASRTATSPMSRGRIDPVADAETVETELMLADLDSLERRVVRAQEDAPAGDKEAKLQVELMEGALALLRAGRPARGAQGRRRRIALRSTRLSLLTSKPVLYVCNVEEASAATGNAFSQQVESDGEGGGRRLRRHLRRDRERRSRSSTPPSRRGASSRRSASRSPASTASSAPATRCSASSPISPSARRKRAPGPSPWARARRRRPA